MKMNRTKKILEDLEDKLAHAVAVDARELLRSKVIDTLLSDEDYTCGQFGAILKELQSKAKDQHYVTTLVSYLFNRLVADGSIKINLHSEERDALSINLHSSEGDEAHLFFKDIDPVTPLYISIAPVQGKRRPIPPNCKADADEAVMIKYAIDGPP